MIRTRSLPAALAVSVAVVAAACGAATTNHSATPAQAAAPGAGVTGAFPGDTLALVTVNTDRQSPAWTTLTGILAHFRRAATPARSESKTRTAAHQQFSFGRDIQRWIGRDAAVGVLGITLSGGRPAPEVVVVAESRDDTRARAFIASHASADGSYRGYAEYRTADGKLVGAIGAGAVLIATDTASLDRVIDTRVTGGSSLATSHAYAATLAALPAGAVASAYVNGPQLAQLAAVGVAFAGHQSTWSALGGALSRAGSLRASAHPHRARLAAVTISPADRAALLARLRQLAGDLRHLTSLGAALVPTSAGLHARLVALTDQSSGHDLTTTHTAVLLAKLPADAVAAADTAFNGSAISTLVSDATTTLRSATTHHRNGPRLAGTLGTILPALLSGEAAAYVTGGAPPTAGLLLTPADPTAATEALQTVAALIAKATHTAAPAASSTGQSIRLHGHVVSWTRSGALVAVGADTDGAPPAGGLASNPTFTAAAAAAGLPGQVDAFAYADVPGVINLARRSDPKHRLATRIATELAAVKSLIGWSAMTPGVASIDLFAAIG